MKKKDNHKEEPITNWLESYKSGAIDEEKLKRQLEGYFYSKRYLVDRALVFDRDRKKISGVSEVIYGEGKSFEQLFVILKTLEKEKIKKILITRLSEEKWRQLKSQFSLTEKDSKKKDVIVDAIVLGAPKDKEKITLIYDKTAHIASTSQLDKKKSAKTDIVIVSAGTSDEKIARETQISLEFFQRKSILISDVGIAGIGRLLGRLEEINRYKLIIAIAGMEASLPTLLSSLSPKPIIAVPTSVGHGANFSGIGALLSLLSSCSPGIGVVNIDSGFSAATLADKLLKSFERT